MLGCDTNDHHASRHTITSPAWEMRYVSHVRRYSKWAVVNIYDLKYLNIDYNINAGLGTDWNAESAGMWS